MSRTPGLHRADPGRSPRTRTAIVALAALAILCSAAAIVILTLA